MFSAALRSVAQKTSEIASELGEKVFQSVEQVKDVATIGNFKFSREYRMLHQVGAQGGFQLFPAPSFPAPRQHSNISSSTSTSLRTSSSTSTINIINDSSSIHGFLGVPVCCSLIVGGHSPPPLQTGSSGPHGIWRIHAGAARSSNAIYKEVSIWVLDKRQLVEAGRG